jgi:hypothetical protein
MKTTTLKTFNVKFILYLLIIINLFYYNTNILIVIISLFILNFFVSRLIKNPKLVIPKDYDWELDKDFIETTYTQKSSLPRLEILASNNKVILEPDTVIKEYAQRIISFFKENKIEITYVKHSTGAMLSQILFSNWVKINNNGNKSPITLANLSNLLADLKSKLGINEITMDTIVPGERSVIGINIPNSKRKTNKLGLYGFLVNEDFDNFVKSKINNGVCNGLPITLGYTANNQQLIYDLIHFPHLLLSGATGSGKSVLLNAIISCLLFKLNPNELQFVLIDPKQLELTPYEGLPHLLKPVVTDVTRVNNILLELFDEHTKRLGKIKEAGCKNLWEYNDKKGTRKLPYIVTIIDELAEVLLSGDTEIVTTLLRLLQATRATGIHFILCTQRPSVKIVSADLKAQCARIALKMQSFYDSKTILDVGGAEELNGQGDGLISIDSNLVRFQSPFISTNETSKLLKEWERLWKHQ